MNDLSQLDPTVRTGGVPMTVKHPGTGQPLMDESGEPVTITLLSSDSVEARKLLHEQAEKTVNDGLGRRRPHVRMEELEQNSIKVLAALTADWKHIIVDGAPLSCTKENATKLYTRFAWIREQVDGFVNDRANFLGN